MHRDQGRYQNLSLDSVCESRSVHLLYREPEPLSYSFLGEPVERIEKQGEQERLP